MHVAISVASGATIVLITAVGVVFMAASWPLALTHHEWGFPGFQAVAALVFGAVAVVASIRRPSNPIGWLWHAGAVMSAVQFLGHQYAIYGLVEAPGTVPAPSVGAWIEEWIWLPILAAIGIFTMLLFPNGRLPGRRWRLVGWVAIASMVVGTVTFALGPVQRVPGAVNPLLPEGPPPIVTGIAYLSATVLALSLAAATLSLGLRFRGSSGVERQQLKWLALGAIVVSISLLVGIAELLLVGTAFGLGSLLTSLAFLTLPVTIALAMLRYGLYEVDRLINRTVVYGTVTALLAAVYVGAVLLFQPLLAQVTGGETFLVALTTLLVASIFQPVRGRVQVVVDRRFFRSRYDTQRSVERLGARLRDEVDIDILGGALLGEVGHAMQPASAAVWLRGR